MNKLLISLFFIFLSALLNAQIITTIAGDGTAGYNGDSILATHARLHGAWNTAVDSAGNIYISDPENIRIRKIGRDGIITTAAGNGTAGYNGDGGKATDAQFSGAIRVAVDGPGNIYISDATYNCIRKVNTNGIITTIAGNSNPGFSGDGGPATLALFNGPVALVSDFYGNLYVSDINNSRIRKIDTNGIINTIAGTGKRSYGGDGGPAVNASINSVWGFALDTAGILFFTDGSNSRIRKIDKSGIITTIAGTGIYGFSGDGGPAIQAKLDYCLGVAADTFGNVYISDGANNRIRKVAPTGIITTIAGNGTAGYSGDGGRATAANLNSPAGISTDVSGNLYISERFTHCIRKIFLQPPVISSFSPKAAFFGDTIVIKGSGLINTTSVEIGDSYLAEYKVINDSTVIAIVENWADSFVKITAPTGSSSLYGFTYLKKCIWTGAENNVWENPANWGCRFVPDNATTAIIYSGTIILNSNVTVWALDISQGASFTVNAPYQLTVLH